MYTKGQTVSVCTRYTMKYIIVILSTPINNKPYINLSVIASQAYFEPATYQVLYNFRIIIGGMGQYGSSDYFGCIAHSTYSFMGFVKLSIE